MQNHLAGFWYKVILQLQFFGSGVKEVQEVPIYSVDQKDFGKFQTIFLVVHVSLVGTLWKECFKVMEVC